MKWNFWQKNEQRSYSDALVTILQQGADGTSADNANIAIVETIGGHWGRGFAIADVTPKSPITDALNPSILEVIGRELALTGEVVFEILVESGVVSLLPVSHYKILGNEGGFVYELSIPGPNQTVTHFRSSDAVVHLRYGRGVRQPWTGDGPIQGGLTTIELAANLENRLKQETGGGVGYVLPSPDSGTNLEKLQADLKALGGKTVLVPTMASGFGGGGATAPASDWKANRIGANPPQSLIQLRQQVSSSIAASAGIPPALMDSDAEGTSLREAWRQFMYGTLTAVATIVQGELQNKLDTPDLRISFDRLFASDLSGRARAFQSMVGGGMDIEKAAGLAGLMERSE